MTGGSPKKPFKKHIQRRTALSSENKLKKQLEPCRKHSNFPLRRRAVDTPLLLQRVSFEKLRKSARSVQKFSFRRRFGQREKGENGKRRSRRSAEAPFLRFGELSCGGRLVQQAALAALKRRERTAFHGVFAEQLCAGPKACAASWRFLSPSWTACSAPPTSVVRPGWKSIAPRPAQPAAPPGAGRNNSPAWQDFSHILSSCP